jgi:hypothetical protein
MMFQSYNEDAGKQRMGKYLSAAAVAACGMVGEASAEILGSTTPDQLDGSAAEEVVLFAGKAIVQALDGGSNGAWIRGNGARFAVNGTLGSGETLSGYSFAFTGTNRLAAFYAVTDYVKSISSFSSAATDPSLAAGRNLIGIALSGDLGATFNYGWIDYELTFDGSGGLQAFTIHGWAYNTNSDEGIVMGQQQAAGSQAVPGLGGLAALAMGAAGVRSRRQRVLA